MKSAEVLPMRLSTRRSPRGERGLKSEPPLPCWFTHGRSPRGERGLKSGEIRRIMKSIWSLPSRGAWIEIRTCLRTQSRFIWSLPSRGAWIEITVSLCSLPWSSSRSPRGERGLKSGEIRRIMKSICRSPRGERGLKSVSPRKGEKGGGRSPRGERGLKLR